MFRPDTGKSRKFFLRYADRNRHFIYKLQPILLIKILVVKKIVVIEDNEDIRMLVEELLEMNNYEVFLASNGYIGIQRIIENEPDLVLCDIMMPEIDGYEVLRTIRKNATLGNIPFIFLSAKNLHSDVRSGMNLGADDYLTKPIEADELLTAIETRLVRSQKREEEINDRIKQIKESMSAVYSHEVNTPLNGIIGLSEVLLRYYKDVIPGNALEMVNHIKEASSRLHRTTNNLILYADLQKYDKETYRKRFENNKCTDCFEMLKDAIKELAEQYKREDDIECSLEEAKINISSHDFEKIVLEAVDNAFKFSKKGEKVKVFSKIENDFIKISVVDNGCGFKISNKDKIGAFVQFERDKNEQQGMGLGLYFIKTLTSFNNARFDIEKNIENGTNLAIWFPLDK